MIGEERIIKNIWKIVPSDEDIPLGELDDITEEATTTVTETESNYISIVHNATIITIIDRNVSFFLLF